MAQAPVQQDFSQPPRVTGKADVDLASMVEWLWSFYASAILNRGLVQNVTISEELQEQFPVLYNLGVLTGIAADRLPYFTGPQAWALATLSAFSRTLLDDTTDVAWRTTLGINSVVTDPELLAIAGLVSAVDKLPYFTGPGTAALADFTSFARTVLAFSTASQWRAQLDLEPDVDVPSYGTGTWTPAFTGLTEVLGGGTVVKAGRWTKTGRIYHWQATVSTTLGATHAAVAGTTYHDLPVGAAQNDTLVAADLTTLIGIGTGVLVAATDRAYVPTWAATSDTVIISGRFEV